MDVQQQRLFLGIEAFLFYGTRPLNSWGWL